MARTAKSDPPPATVYRGDIAEEFSPFAQGGLHTVADLASWKVKIEEPVTTTYKGVAVYKLTCWTQGPVLLQALNLLEPLDLPSMGYNSARYIHALYQAMNLAYADRDFYYGDPDFPPEEPIRTLLSKSYAAERRKLIDWKKNNPDVRPGDPYQFDGKENPFANFLKQWSNTRTNRTDSGRRSTPSSENSALRVPDSAIGETQAELDAAFRAGTTSIQAADEKGWAVSITPSGG